MKNKVKWYTDILGLILAFFIAHQWSIGHEATVIFTIVWLLVLISFRQARDLDY